VLATELKEVQCFNFVNLEMNFQPSQE